MIFRKKKSNEPMTLEQAKRKLKRAARIIAALLISFLALQICNAPKIRQQKQEEKEYQNALKRLNDQLDSIVRKYFNPSWVVVSVDDPIVMEYRQKDSAAPYITRRFRLADTLGNPAGTGIQIADTSLNKSSLYWFSKQDSSMNRRIERGKELIKKFYEEQNKEQ